MPARCSYPKYFNRLSKSLASFNDYELFRIYHENKNLQQTIDYSLMMIESDMDDDGAFQEWINETVQIYEQYMEKIEPEGQMFTIHDINEGIKKSSITVLEIINDRRKQ